MSGRNERINEVACIWLGLEEMEIMKQDVLLLPDSPGGARAPVFAVLRATGWFRSESWVLVRWDRCGFSLSYQEVTRRARCLMFSCFYLLWVGG